MLDFDQLRDIIFAKELLLRKRGTMRICEQTLISRVRTLVQNLYIERKQPCSEADREMFRKVIETLTGQETAIVTRTSDMIHRCTYSGAAPATYQLLKGVYSEPKPTLISNQSSIVQPIPLSNQSFN